MTAVGQRVGRVVDEPGSALQSCAIINRWSVCGFQRSALEYECPSFLFAPYQVTAGQSLPDTSLSQVWSAYRSLDDTQWLGAAELEHHQLIQFRVLLDHCQQHVPYYRELLARHGVNCASIQSMNDLRRIPILSRLTWQDHFDQFCAEQLPHGTVALDEDRTSGTSGVPIRVLKTNMFYVWWLAFYLRDLEWSDLRPNGYDGVDSGHAQDRCGT